MEVRVLFWAQMKKSYLLVVPVLLLLFTLWFYSQKPLGTRLTINNHTFSVELALTDTQKAKGLGDRDSLPAETGMLFPYDHPDRYTFWMKGMRFPLDFIWINGNYVADITPDVPIAQNGQPLAIYQPKVPADKIFEVKAGTVAEDGIKIGDSVKITD